MDGIFDYFDAAAQDAMRRCTGCGKCVEICPAADAAGIDKSDAPGIVASCAGSGWASSTPT